MRYEIIINNDTKLVMTKEEFGYTDVLETLEQAKFIRIVTYNISKESDILINKLELFPEDKDIIIITNVPGRFQRYTNLYARRRAKQTIDNYIERLNPNNYNANMRTFFNFGNHSKIIMTDKIAYIGSANFSDESKNNNECGVLIKDKLVIDEINSQFIKMLIDDSISYYSSKYTKVFVTMTNLLTRAELYFEDYYWGFFADSGHPHHGRGDEYRSFNASLSPVLVEKIESLSYEIEETISDFNNHEIYPEIFENLDLNLCEEMKEWFGTDSQLEEFSRFNVQEKTNELFEEYLLDGDPDSIDDYAQIAFNNAGEENMNLADEIYDTALHGMGILKRLIEFLINIIKELESNKEVNKSIDNT